MPKNYEHLQFHQKILIPATSPMFNVLLLVVVVVAAVPAERLQHLECSGFAESDKIVQQIQTV